MTQLNDGKPHYELAPEVPEWAERVPAIPHFRTQYHPLFLNAHDMPDHNGPRQYIGMDYRCIICKHIQPAGAPGVDHQCPKCGTFYKYTALVNNCWLYFWKDNRQKLVIESPVTMAVKEALEKKE
jgi:hypothetical protein